MIEILIFELRENFRSRWLFVYTGFLALSVSALNYFGDENGTRLITSLMNIVLLIVPLFAISFAGLSFLESIPFAEVLLSKSVTRTEYFFGKYLGVSLSLSLGLVVGVGVPGVLSFYSDLTFLILFLELIVFGLTLVFIFVSLAFLLSSFFKKGELIISGALLIWLYFFIFFDSIVFMLSVYLGEYPVEIPSLIIILFNPIDLVRIVMVLQTKASVLLGFSGAFLLKTIGLKSVILLSILFLSGWITVPLWISYKKFIKRNF
ncbi:ABC transporter permease [Leptospira sp. 201903071]|uniref:ABC transporter permease subunit n=1 Tax=Leptospira ainazelensis TaxID=2810034 RepID=UPI00196547CE|nr:ABC transporter permease subunit [Leptospira ainazelensis]MBM9502082.1 ABC transporter permease [Leptospira ainazelensis]